MPEPVSRQHLWTQVFARREGWLLGYFRKRLAQPADARDLVQEVYLRILHTDRGEATTIADPEAYDEMVELSGQTLAPVIDVDGEVLADFGPEELAKFLEKLKHK